MGFPACCPGVFLYFVCLPTPVQQGCKMRAPWLVCQHFVLIAHSTETMVGNNKTPAS